MKKNKMMRIASVLLVVTLLTTCSIFGTFAKYTTSDSGSDSARVAKWGVTAVVSGDLFGDDYATGSNSATAGMISATYTGSVDNHTSGSTAGDKKIVAPGTNNLTGVTITINGTPEVKNTVAFTSTAANNKNIYLKGGSSGNAVEYGTMVAVTGITKDNFGDGTYYTEATAGGTTTYTQAPTWSDEHDQYYELHDAVELAADYYPVVWTVTKDGTSHTYTKVADMVADLERAATAGAVDYGFNKTTDSMVAIDSSVQITWAWAIENGSTDAEKALSSKADTILGNIIAADTDAVPVKAGETTGTYVTLAAGTDYCTDVAFNYSIAITQVD